MDLSKLEEMDKICKNRYAAIIVASSQARKLNLQLSAEEADPDKTDKKDKVTVQAIKDLLKGKIKYEYPDTKPKSIE